MVKTSRRRRSKRRPYKTSNKKRKRKTKYSYKKKNHVGGGMIDKIWKSIKETSLFKDCKKSPTLEDFKRFIELVENGEVDKLADEIIKLSLKSLSKEQVVDKIEYVKRLSKPELVKQLKKYFPGLLELFKKRRRGSLSKNPSAGHVKSRSSKSNLSKSNLSKKGGGDGGMSALLSFGVVLLIFALCYGMTHACSYCLGRQMDAEIERYNARERDREEANRRNRRLMRQQWGVTVVDQDTPHRPGEVPETGDSLDTAAELAAVRRSPVNRQFYNSGNPLINEDSEIDMHIEVIDVEQGKMNQEQDKCVICLEELSPTDTEDQVVVKLKSCNHKFHKECITQCLKSQDTCPTCRTKVKKSESREGRKVGI